MADEKKPKSEQKPRAEKAEKAGEGAAEDGGKRAKGGEGALSVRGGQGHDDRRGRPRALAREVQAAGHPGADEAVQLQEPDAGSPAAEDRGQHGSRRRRREPEDHRHRGRGPEGDQRPEAGRDAREEGDRQLQAARGHPHRRDGHAAQRAHVGVPRPPRDAGAPAHARLQGRLAQGVRRQGQLHARPQASRSSSPRSTTTRSTRSRV